MTTPSTVRRWIRGHSPLSGFDDGASVLRFFSHAPSNEAEEFLLRDLGRGLARLIPESPPARDQRDDDDLIGDGDDGRR
ncbi:hypothetical protein ACVCAH_27950 [Micromonospora sp. LZ34]